MNDYKQICTVPMMPVVAMLMKTFMLKIMLMLINGHLIVDVELGGDR